MITKRLGPVSAYLEAVAAGYSGTREQFQELLANSANYAQTASDSADSAALSATTAFSRATEANTSASEASAFAESAANSRSDAIASATSAQENAKIAQESAASAQTSASSAAASAASAQQNFNVLSARIDEQDRQIANKQNTLTAGSGISIVGNVISCTFANGNEVSF